MFTALIMKKLGRIAPQLRTVEDWLHTYHIIVDEMPIIQNTKNGHMAFARKFCQQFSGRRLATITRSEIITYIDAEYANSQNYGRQMATEIKMMLTAAVEEGWIKKNPAVRLRKLPVTVQRQRITLAQWQTLHKHAKRNTPPWFAPLLELALVTGQRRGDLCKMLFCDITENWLYIQQQKTGMQIALPLNLQLNAIDMSLADVIERCKHYAVPGDNIIRGRYGQPLQPNTISDTFRRTWRNVFGAWDKVGTPPTLHEVRSLSERLYREQGINTRILLGHKSWAMTDGYNDDRGLSGPWRRLEISN